MTDVTTSSPLVHVRLLRFPLRLHLRTQEHYDGVMREFALISMSDPGSSHVPVQLLALAQELRRYEVSTSDVERDAARERGEEFVDLDYAVPREMAPHLRTLHELLDEADSYCTSEQLLSPPMSDEVRQFRPWMREQFTQQVAGQPPQPWDGP